MAAPTSIAKQLFKLANGEPSTHGRFADWLLFDPAFLVLNGETWWSAVRLLTGAFRLEGLI
jgi:hypothetical protein